MPHVNAEQAKVDINAKLQRWMADCVKNGGKGHTTTHGATNTLGVGYPDSSESNPATILQTEWTALTAWWPSLNLDVQYHRWNVGSMGGGGGVQDLCCSCNVCPKVEKRDFGSPTGTSQRLRTFVYHLKVVLVAPVEPPKLVAPPPPIAAPKLPVLPALTIAVRASSNDKLDSLRLEYKIDAKGTPFTGKLDDNGKARITLPPGVRLAECTFSFEGNRGTSMKAGENYLLPGGRYTVQLSGG